VDADPFGLTPFIVDDLTKLHPGALRFWFFGDDWNATLDMALAKRSLDVPRINHNLYNDLWLAESAGAGAWIVAAKEWTPDEFAQLAEYLASADTSQGMGKLRADQGHPMPWADTLPHLYIEYSDEAWNFPNYSWPFDIWHLDVYGAFAKE